MSSLTTPVSGSMKSHKISPAMRAVLGQVFINMPWRYIGRYIDLVLENGINIEIGFEAEDVESSSAGAVCAAIGRMREKGSRITFHGPFWDLSSGSIDPGIRGVSVSRLGSLFDLVDKTRPEQVVCHTGFDPRHHKGHRRAWIENSLSTWAPFVKRAEILRTPLALENVWEEDPELHLELLEGIKSPWLGFCLDVGHQHSFSRTTLDKWLHATWPYLKEVHLHDNDGSFDTHLPIGSGTIDFDYLFNFLGEKKISPVLTMEPHSVEHMSETLAGLAAMVSFNEFVSSRTSGPGREGGAHGYRGA
jgi:sugar phosphate isomerase/epimerase